MGKVVSFNLLKEVLAWESQWIVRQNIQSFLLRSPRWVKHEKNALSMSTLLIFNESSGIGKPLESPAERSVLSLT